MKKIIFIFFIFIHINTFAQPGFLKIYDSKEYSQNIFSGLLYDEDNDDIITSGITLSEGRIAIRFTRFDTLGNRFNNNIIRDSATHLSIRAFRSNLLKTNNGNYIMTGISNPNSFGNFIYTIKVDPDLNLFSFNKYYAPDTIKFFENSIIEVGDGFLMLGNYSYYLDTTTAISHSDTVETVYLTNINRLLLKLDKNGKELWRKEDKVSDPFTTTYKIKQDGDDTFVICGSRRNKEKFYSTLHAIDKNGNPKWSMEKTFIINGFTIGSIFDFIHNPDGTWICSTIISTEYHEEYGDYTDQLAIFKMDKNFDLIWFKKLPQQTVGFRIALTNLIKTKDGNYLASGNYTVIMVHHKFDNNGNEIWSRLDRCYPNQNYSTTNLSKTIELPSGNIMSCGFAGNTDIDNRGNFGFLMKLTADGCMDIEDCPDWVAIEDLAKESLEIKIYPNPVSEYASFTKIDEILQKKVDIKIYDTMGKHIQDLQISEFEKSFQWAVSNLANGVYFCQMYLDGELFAVEKLIKQ